MRHIKRFTFVGFQINMLVDEDEIVTIEKVKTLLSKRKLFTWLEDQYGDKIDLSLYSKELLLEMEEYFGSLADTIDEDRKLGITKNGLCLLVSYCLNGTQSKPDNYDWKYLNS